MNVRFRYIVFLYIFIITLTITNCAQNQKKPKGGKRSKLRSAVAGLSPSLKTSGKGSKLRSAVGLSPILKITDIDQLQDLILHEPDLIKIAAYKTLINLYKKDKEKKSASSLLPAIIRGATELVKYYSVISNYVKANYSLCQGRDYAKKCIQLLKEHEGLCYKLKTELYAAFFLSHILHSNSWMKKHLMESYAKAKDLLPDDKTLSFLRTKIKCEIKLMVQNKSKPHKILLETFVLGSTKNENSHDYCEALLEYKEQIREVGSSFGEFYFLLGRAYAKNNEYKKAIESLQNALKDEITDTVSLKINSGVQKLLAKMFLRVYS